ncbi:MAG: cytochrome P450 [Nostocales cyanobacterium]|nr:MAG: cytochrome P450 [Nostocales cyanobacterium]TAF19460.1 MAG: cytochrome P450 [Nostocales cyanobacterium]
MQLPKGPKIPAFLQILNWVISPMSYMEKCAKTYGETFTLKLDTKNQPIIFTSNPEAIQQILTKDTSCNNIN